MKKWEVIMIFFIELKRGGTRKYFGVEVMGWGVGVGDFQHFIYGFHLTFKTVSDRTFYRD